MMEKTTYFDLNLPGASDASDITKVSENFGIIDEQMHKPPLTVNEVGPDPTTRNLQLTTIPLADNLTSDSAQLITETFIIHTTGGAASIGNGNAMLTDIRGYMIKNGYVPASVQMSVYPAERDEGQIDISCSIDDAEFLQAASGTSGTMSFMYTTDWDNDPANYGITVSGTPVAGDQIVVVFNKGNRGNIVAANPTAFVSTGWNLYNHSAGYARVTDYSDEYGYMIEGFYTGLEFAETLGGSRTTITPVNGHFTVPSDGYLFVLGGNSTDTKVWATWSDWTETANGGVFDAYTQSSVDLSGIMVNFPYGLLRVGNVFDEINFNTGKAYSRVRRLEYTQENLDAVIASGLPYDVDVSYIYTARQNAESFDISVTGAYTANGHGTEFFEGTNAPVVASSLYGQDLKDKLKRNVLTISQQTLTSAQQVQVRRNIGAADESSLASLSESLQDLVVTKRYSTSITVPANSFADVKASELGISTPSGYAPFAVLEFQATSHVLAFSRLIASATGSGTVMIVHNYSASDRTVNASITIAYIKTEFFKSM